MTMVAACSFNDGAVVISDSRVTWEVAGKYLANDSLQKIVNLGPKISLSYAGSVYLATKTIQHLRQKAKTSVRYQHIRKIASEIPRIAKHYFKTYPSFAKYGLDLIVAGVDDSGKILVYHYGCPDFQSNQIVDGFTIIGSGVVARPYLEDNFSKINLPANDLKRKADLLNRGFDGALVKYQAQYVGGLLQVILISSKGILPLHHFSMTIDPIAPSDYLGIRMEKGRWIQEEASGKQSKFLEPHELMRVQPQEKRIYEYFPRTDEKKYRYYLSYFMTCLKVDRTHGSTVFRGNLTQIGSYKYPRILPVVASLGFWGPAGDRELKLRIDNGHKTRVIHSQKVGDWYYPERFEIDVLLKIEVNTPGPLFLDCLIDDFLLARKALFFSDLRGEKPAQSGEESKKIYSDLSKRMPEEHRKCSDPLIEKKNVFLDYLVLCEKVSSEDQNTTFKIEGEVRALYWKSYPLTYKFCIASSFRLKPGKHFMEVKLKYAITSEEHQIAKCELENNSSCISVPVYADDLIAQIPKAGIYYVNVYVDGEFVGCVLLFAETDKPQFSYNLYKEELDRIANGEFMILLARSQQKPNSKTNADG
jgi:hypothetical protein